MAGGGTVSLVVVHKEAAGLMRLFYDTKEISSRTVAAAAAVEVTLLLLFIVV